MAKTPAAEAKHPLRRWRGKHKISLANLASQLGKSAATVSRYETGDVAPPLSVVWQIERITSGKVRATHWREVAA